MNTDVLHGKWLEIKGMIKEKWGKLTGNEFGAIEGKCEKLLGLLRKKYGYIRDKAEPEYNDSVELAAIVSHIRYVMPEKKDVMTIAFIARYGRPLLAKKQESQIVNNEQTQRNPIDRYSRLFRRHNHMASQ